MAAVQAPGRGRWVGPPVPTAADANCSPAAFGRGLRPGGKDPWDFTGWSLLVGQPYPPGSTVRHDENHRRDRHGGTARVLQTAQVVARVVSADVEAVHVSGDARTSEGQFAPAAAERANVPLRLLGGPTITAIVEETTADDVVACVMGTHSAPTGPGPPGHITLGVVRALDETGVRGSAGGRRAGGAERTRTRPVPDGEPAVIGGERRQCCADWPT